MPITNPVIIIAGPTASGKSSLAIDLALSLDGEVINADSMQVYNELSILTARPNANDSIRVPHHLFGVIPAGQRCSTGRWLEMCMEAIRDVWSRNKLPVLVGGTGLYFKALTEGLASIPEIDPEVVKSEQAHYHQIGAQAFRKQLFNVDPTTASRLPASDIQRLVRASAVFKATGRTLTEWQQQQSPGPALKANFITVALIPERDHLYDSINQRFDAMMKAGAIEEVKALKALNLDPSLPAMKALGVPDLLAYVDGQVSLEEATEKSAQRSRNYAKRQLTWLRHQMSADYSLIPPLNEAQKMEFIDVIGSRIG